MSEDVSEKALIVAAVRGDAVSLQQLLMQHFPALEQHIAQRIPARARKHIGAEDLLQIVFSQAFRDIDRFVDRGEGSFLAWLRKIADNRIIYALRRIDKGGKHQLSGAHFENSSYLDDLIDAVAHDSVSASVAAAGNEVVHAIQLAIAGLPDAQKEVIWEAFIAGKPVDQIAQETGRTTDAVRGLIHRGKQNLRVAMGQSARWFSAR